MRCSPRRTVGCQHPSSSGMVRAQPQSCKLLLAMLVGSVVLFAAADARPDNLAEWGLTLTGPGLAAPIRIGGTDYSTLLDLLGLLPTALGVSSAAPSPSSNLGARYEVVYRVKVLDGRTFVAQQDLYPYASERPWTFTRPDQIYFDDSLGGEYQVRSGWWHSKDTQRAFDIMLADGFPGTPPSARGRRLFTPIALAMVLTGVVAVVLLTLRRRRSPQPSAQGR
jgi:hypothetical protein